MSSTQSVPVGTSTGATGACIGVTIPIPEPHGQYLQERRSDFGDPEAEDVPAHITLLPPTVVTAADYAAFARHCKEVAARHAPFTVVLRGTGTFRPVSDVVYVQVAQGVSACERLETDLRSGPIVRNLDFYYHPHVTVAHKVPEAALDRAFEELATYSVTFRVDDFILYELGDDEVWTAVQGFRLQGG